MPKPFLKLMKNDDATELLINSPNAFILLYQIAIRAKRKNGFDVNGLDIGQAVVGDHKSIKLTERKYRTAKAQLEKWGFATFEATSRGTIATLINSRVFDINEEGRRRPSDDQATSKTTSKTTSQNRAKSQIEPGGYGGDKTPSDEQNDEHGVRKTTTKEIIKKKEGKEGTSPQVPFQTILDLYKAALPGHPQPIMLSEERKKAIKARWNTSGKTKSPDWWKQYFSLVAQSDFLTGHNERNWRADFDWLLRKSNFMKVLEGNYNKN